MFAVCAAGSVPLFAAGSSVPRIGGIDGSLHVLAVIFIRFAGLSGRPESFAPLCASPGTGPKPSGVAPLRLILATYAAVDVVPGSGGYGYAYAGRVVGAGGRDEGGKGSGGLMEGSCAPKGNEENGPSSPSSASSSWVRSTVECRQSLRLRSLDILLGFRREGAWRVMGQENANTGRTTHLIAIGLRGKQHVHEIHLDCRIERFATCDRPRTAYPC
jgi:hypothetical protein